MAFRNSLRSHGILIEIMTRFILATACLLTGSLTGCDNRTRDDVRWDQIADAQKAAKDVQPWPEADSPWSNAEHRTGVAW